MVRIVLAEDHTIVRQGLRSLLEQESDFQVVGEVDNGLDAVTITEALCPDVLIVDLIMPGLPGLEVVRRVSESCPSTHPIVLSMYSVEAYVLEALRNGAQAYVIKGADAEELYCAIHSVLAGERYLSSPLSDRAIESYIEQATAVIPDRYSMLTAREREILQLTAEGRSRGEIAETLSISPRTVETHRTNLMRKLGINSQNELVLYAVRRGLITVDT